MLQALFSLRFRRLLASVWLVAGLGSVALVQARTPVESVVIAPVAVAQLPPEGRQTYQLIHAGGPFPYSKDGSVFGNRERLLPAQRRGYYLEYTVKTPGSRDRGARRIICGGAPRTPDACYYSSDHYASFRRIAD